MNTRAKYAIEARELAGRRAEEGAVLGNAVNARSKRQRLTTLLSGSPLRSLRSSRSAQSPQLEAAE